MGIEDLLVGRERITHRALRGRPRSVEWGPRRKTTMDPMPTGEWPRDTAASPDRSISVRISTLPVQDRTAPRGLIRAATPLCVDYFI